MFSMLRTRCPNCDKLLAVNDARPRIAIVCPTCKHRFRLPVREEEEVHVLEVVEDELEIHEHEEPVRHPRRRKKRKPKQPRSSDLLEAIPLSYMAQTNIGVGIGILVHIIAAFILMT